MEPAAPPQDEAAATGPRPRERRIQRWILAGLAGGIVLGLAANLLTAPAGPLAAHRGKLESAIREVIEPAGRIFLRLLFMTVLPLVVSALTLGIHELGDLKRIGRIGLKTLVFTLVLSGISVAIGLALVNTIGPGRRIGPEKQEAVRALIARGEAEVRKAEDQSKKPRLERIVEAVIPRNPVESAARAFDGDMLAVMCFAVLFGLALGACGSARTAPVIRFFEGVYDASLWLVGLALLLAPAGVLCLVFAMTARLGTDIVTLLGAYVLTVLAGLAIQQILVYSLVLRAFCGVSPLWFFTRIRPVMVTAFSTSSSNATLPTTIHIARTRLGIPSRIANFVLTLGSTFNQNGTALFEGVTVLFIAQFYGVPLGFDQQLTVLAMSVAAGIGTAGVPGGSIPLIVPVLVSVGVPGEGIAIILGVDRLLDMCRTVLNVTGDLVAAAFVARGEGEEAP